MSNMRNVKKHLKAKPVKAQDVANLCFKCQECGKGFRTKSILLKHQRAVHWVKEKERKRNEKEKIVEEILKGPNDSLVYHCCFCSLNFRTKEEQLDHDREKHCNKEGDFVCFECNFSFPVKKTVLEHFAEEHSQKHTNGLRGTLYQGKLMCCQKCDQAFFSQSLLRMHLHQTHSIKLSQKDCLLCFKELPSQRKAAIHMERVHVGSKFRCQQNVGNWRSIANGFDVGCNQMFSTIDELDEHVHEKHTRADKYTCHICGKTFRALERAKFNRHTESHSMGEPTFKCDSCSKCFFFEIELIGHKKKIHKTLYCELCEFKTSGNNGLKNHFLSNHTNEKPHVCSKCGKGFALSYHLRRHMEIHEPVRKYECSVCGKKFIAARHLTTHSKIHSKTYAAKCEICKKKFVQKFNMTLHMRKHHPQFTDSSTAINN